MKRADQLAALLALYQPNTGRGNFQPDVASRGANRVLAKAIVALGLDTDGGVAATFRRLDAEDWERSEAAMARFNAREAR